MIHVTPHGQIMTTKLHRLAQTVYARQETFTDWLTVRTLLLRATAGFAALRHMSPRPGNESQRPTAANEAVSISVMTREGAQNLLVSCPLGPRHILNVTVRYKPKPLKVEQYGYHGEVSRWSRHAVNSSHSEVVPLISDVECETGSWKKNLKSETAMKNAGIKTIQQCLIGLKSDGTDDGTLSRPRICKPLYATRQATELTTV